MPLNTIHHSVMHSILGSRVNNVRNTAASAGGCCVWHFSQVLDPVKTLICTHSDTSGGICEMLAAKWLETHAKGEHISKWITKENDQHIDPNKIRQLMQLFAVGITMTPNAMIGNPNSNTQTDQKRATEIWLDQQGISRRKIIANGIKMLDQSMYHLPRESIGNRNGDRINFATEIAHAITSSSGSYKMIGIQGSQHAHSVAAWSESDIVFFDPNFGEFWFENIEDFKNWFPTFWYSSGYGTPLIGLSESYEILEYGIKI